MSTNDQDIREMLWRAIEAPCGIEIECSDVETLKRRLYTVRAKERQAGNTAFDQLQFITPPLKADIRIWLVKLTQAATKGEKGETINGSE